MCACARTYICVRVQVEAYSGAIGGLPQSLSTLLFEAGSLNPEFAILASQASQLAAGTPICTFPALKVQEAMPTWRLKGCRDLNTALNQTATFDRSEINPEQTTLKTPGEFRPLMQSTDYLCQSSCSRALETHSLKDHDLRPCHIGRMHPTLNRQSLKAQTSPSFPNPS